MQHWDFSNQQKKEVILNAGHLTNPKIRGTWFLLVPHK